MKKRKRRRAKESDDISNKTIAVLLTITIILSAVGTWLMVTSKPEVVIYQQQGEFAQEAGNKISFSLVNEDALEKPS